MLYVFDCDNVLCQDSFEELFGGQWGMAPQWTTCSRCGATMRRRGVYWNRVVGPVWDQLETYNNMLLTNKQRTNGVELKTGKQIEAFEQKHGLIRHDMASREYRQIREREMDDLADMQRVAAEGGQQAAFDYVDETEIIEASGLSHFEYLRWKEATDDAESQLRNSPDRFAGQLSDTLCDAGGTGELTDDAHCGA